MGVLRFHGVLMAATVVLAVGCQQGGRTPVDEKRDPYFLTGQKRKRQGDYAGAVQAYQVALERNPRSAAAHLELGCCTRTISCLHVLPLPCIITRAISHCVRTLLRPNSSVAAFAPASLN